MKTKRWLIPFALGLGLTLVWALRGRDGASVAAPRDERFIEVANAPTAELHVCPSGCAYSSIQGAVDAASDGDVIKVAAGTYTDVRHRDDLTQIVYIDKTVTLRGGYTAENWATSDPENNPTTLDAGGQGRVMLITGASSPIIEGLRLTGGDATGLPGGVLGQGSGGGVYVLAAMASVRDNQVFSNTARFGGGLYLERSPATIGGNIISGNTASNGEGGGLYLKESRATISGNTIIYNTAAWSGGGLYLRYSDATISDNAITGNSATQGGGGLKLNGSDATISWNIISLNSASSSGGLNLEESRATINGNTITGNIAEWGPAGIRTYDSVVTFSDNTISGNAASSGEGGGLHLSWSDATLINNAITGNQGEGLSIREGSLRSLHTTIARNSAPGGSDPGRGIYITGAATVALTNTILVDQAVGIYVEKGITAVLESTLWNGNAIDRGGGGTVIHRNDHTGDPVFLDPGAGDYHIGPGSAAIDIGIDAGVDYDMDDDPRPAAFGFDVGADERPGTSLHIDKAAWPLYLNTDQAVTYTLVVTSAGVDAATGLWLTDTLPALQQAVDAATSQGSCAVPAGWGGTATCDLRTLLPGDSARITLTARVTTTPGQLAWPMRNTAQVRAAEASHIATADTVLHDCHVRLNDGATEYSTVQAGVDASTRPDDVVKVSGYCVGVTARAGAAQIVYLDKTLLLQGGWNGAFTERDAARFPTTLDARGRGRVLYIREPAPGAGISPTVEGLRLTGGDASGLRGAGPWWGDAGGGVYILTATAVIRDNWIFGNTASSAFPDASTGGGLFLFKNGTMLSGNTISENSAGHGGGLYLERGNATLNDNAVLGNTAVREGSGIYLYGSDATIVDNTVSGNAIPGYTDLGHGGGLYLKGSTATISGNTVSGNTGYGLVLDSSDATISGNTIANNSTPEEYGHAGGLYVHFGEAVISGNVVSGNSDSGISLAGSDATISGNTITGNATNWYGGGLSLVYSDATISGNTITGNSAASRGGGLYLGASDATLINNAVTDNQVNSHGSGLYIHNSSPHLLHNTIARNGAFGGNGDGSGIYVATLYGEPHSTVALTNTILVDHAVGISVTAGNTATLESTLWNGNTTDWSGGGAILHSNDYAGDPAFMGAGKGAYHIGPGSAAVDAGIDAGVDHDIDGEPRPLGSGYDLGADEAGLVVIKLAYPDWVQPGAQLTYTIRITNVTDADLHATITDTLPFSVALDKTAGGTLALPGGTAVLPDGAVAVAWTAVITAPGGDWMGTLLMTVDEDYRGSLTNLVVVTTEEGAMGTASVTVSAGSTIYLPLVMRGFP